MLGKTSIQDDDSDDLDDDDDDGDAHKGPPSKQRGKQIISSSSSSDKEFRTILEKSRLETHGGGESSKAPQEQMTATQEPQPMNLNLNSYQEDIPEQEPPTSNDLKDQILHDGEEDTPTLAEVFINERRATIKFISNAEVRLHKRLIKMKKHFDDLLDLRFTEVHRHIRSNLMIQQVFNSEQKAQLQIQLANQPAQLEAIHKALAELRAKDEELENQILTLQQAQARADALHAAAETSAPVNSISTLPTNLEQALQKITEHEEYITYLKNKEFPAMLQLSQKFLSEQQAHVQAYDQLTKAIKNNFLVIQKNTQETFWKQGCDIQRLAQEVDEAKKILKKVEEEVHVDIKTDLQDVNNALNAMSITVYGLKNKQEESDEEIEALYQDIDDAKKGEATLAGPSSKRQIAAKKAAETRRKNKLLQEEAEIRKRKAEEAKAREEAKKKEEDKQLK
ncbi:unnamed protein product [Cuscuta epithymum]|uniref:Uncharacterized protein n=1 Tax=Cuscuta epithymum TaxID=186058 RepID=A0AAV0EJ91_9ASTE|nr:unnamed protein product [Cuscuta epithymum]